MAITDDNVGFHRESCSPFDKLSSVGAPDHGTMGFSNEAFFLSDIGVKEPPSWVREGWIDPQNWKGLDNRNEVDFPNDVEDSIAWFSKQKKSEVKDDNLEVKHDNLISRADTISGISEKEGTFPHTLSSEPIAGGDSVINTHFITSNSPVAYRSTEDSTSSVSGQKIDSGTRDAISHSPVLTGRNAGALMTDGSSLLFHAVSSVIRDAFLGCFRCFPCSQGQLACFDEVDTEPKGAWFDCKRVQSKDNFCYSNPTINLWEDVTGESGVNRLEEPNRDKEVDDVEAAPVCTLRGGVHHTQLQEGTTLSESQTSAGETGENESGGSHDVFVTKDSAKISFAMQLEEDYKQRAADLGRSEGRKSDSTHLSSDKALEFINSSSPNTSVGWQAFDWRESEEEFPDLPESNLELTDFNISHGGEEFMSDDVHGDVWEDTELKEAFGIYNLNAFYSYGSNSPIVLSSNPCKPLNEKFDEVFPAIQPVPKPNIPNDQSASTNIVCAGKTSTKENENALSHKKWISQVALSNIVRQFLSLEGRDSFSRNFRLYKDNLNCNNYFIYSGRRITKRLLFDLVNEKLLCYREKYFHSYPLNVNYIPTEKIESQVFQVLNNTNLKQCERLKHKKIYDTVKFENDSMISTVVAENLKREEWSWTDYAREEDERKQSVSKEILNELLFDTVSLFNIIIKRKCR